MLPRRVFRFGFDLDLRLSSQRDARPGRRPHPHLTHHNNPLISPLPIFSFPMAPNFLGFFQRRDNPKALRKSSEPSLHSRPKSPAGLPHASSNKSSLPSPSIADTSDQLEGSELSLEAEYVLADADSPTLTTGYVYPPASSSSNASNAANATTKLKMPFRRKQSTPDKLTTTVTPQNLVSPILPPKEPHKFSMESSVSSLLPPPSRSAIFGSYADPHNALSTRSLPQDVPLIHSRMSFNASQDYDTMSNPDSHTTSLPAPLSKQPSKGGLFSWARPRGRTKSKPALPDPSLHSPPVLTLPPTDLSFDLKSFRHVSSPETTPPSSNTPLNTSPQPRPPRPPHPRGDSCASDPSQRISVAAFREAQARRSTADSPVPSSSGDRDSFASSQVRIRQPSSLLATPPSGPTAGPQARFPSSRSPPSRSSTAPLSFSTSVTSSESSEEEESESEEEATLRPTRKRTITSRSVHSEFGHRSSPISKFSATRSDIGHGVSSGLTSRPSPTPRNARNSPGLEASGSGSGSSSVYSNARGSVSTSALVPANRVAGILKHPTGPFFVVSLLLVYERRYQPQNQCNPHNVRAREPPHLLNHRPSPPILMTRPYRRLSPLSVQAVRCRALPGHLLVAQQSH